MDGTTTRRAYSQSQVTIDNFSEVPTQTPTAATTTTGTYKKSNGTITTDVTNVIAVLGEKGITTTTLVTKISTKKGGELEIVAKAPSIRKYQPSTGKPHPTDSILRIEQLSQTTAHKDADTPPLKQQGSIQGQRSHKKRLSSEITIRPQKESKTIGTKARTPKDNTKLM